MCQKVPAQMQSLYNLQGKMYPLLESQKMSVGELVRDTVCFAHLPYKEQLVLNSKRIKNEVEWIMQRYFRKQKLPKFHNCIAVEKTNHYTIRIAIDLYRNERRIEAGILHASQWKESNPILMPLQDLIFIPPRVTSLVDKFVEWCKTPSGLTVATSERLPGHVSRLTIQLSSREEIVMTILVCVPSRRGSEDDPLNLDVLSQEKLDELEEKCKRFKYLFGEVYKLKAVYVRPMKKMTAFSPRKMFNNNNEVALAAGTEVEEPPNSKLGLYIEPKGEWSLSHIGEGKLLDWVIKLAGITNESTVCVSAGLSKFIPFYLAKRAKEVIVVPHHLSPEALKSFSESLMKEVKTRNGTNNVEVIPNETYKFDEHESKLKEATLIVWGPHQVWLKLRSLIRRGVAKLVFTNDSEARLSWYLKHFAFEGFMPVQVVPVDIMPHCKQCGAVVLLQRLSQFRPQPINRKASPTRYMEPTEGLQESSYPLKRRADEMLDYGGMMNVPINNWEEAYTREGMGVAGSRWPESQRPAPPPLMDMTPLESSHLPYGQQPQSEFPPQAPSVTASLLQKVLEILTPQQQELKREGWPGSNNPEMSNHGGWSNNSLEDGNFRGGRSLGDGGRSMGERKWPQSHLAEPAPQPAPPASQLPSVTASQLQKVLEILSAPQQGPETEEWHRSNNPFERTADEMRNQDEMMGPPSNTLEGSNYRQGRSMGGGGRMKEDRKKGVGRYLAEPSLPLDMTERSPSHHLLGEHSQPARSSGQALSQPPSVSSSQLQKVLELLSAFQQKPESEGWQESNYPLKRKAEEVGNYDNRNMRWPNDGWEDGNFREAWSSRDSGGMSVDWRRGAQSQWGETEPLMASAAGPAPPLLPLDRQLPTTSSTAQLLPQLPPSSTTPIQSVLQVLGAAQQLVTLKQSQERNQDQWSSNLEDAVVITEILRRQQSHRPPSDPYMANQEVFDQPPQQLAPAWQGNPQWGNRGGRQGRGSQKGRRQNNRRRY